MQALQRLFYVTAGLDEDTASATWGAVLSPLFEPRAWDNSTKQPTGSAAGVIIGDMIIAKVTFGAQEFIRNADRIAATPDHILLHLYLSGGFNGSITGQNTTIGPGTVAVIDLAKEVRTRAFASNTVSFIVPRKLLTNVTFDTLTPRLDQRRNDLLAAHIRSLQERSMQLSEADVADTIADSANFLNRLLTLSDSSAWKTEESDNDISSLTEAAIRDNLTVSELSPDWLAQKLGISRASLYRVFANEGGIMQYVQERRLLAVQAALSDPLETRRLSRIAADLGFNSQAHFSRAFRARFGVTASEYRKVQIEASAATQLTSPEVVQRWWMSVASKA